MTETADTTPEPTAETAPADEPDQQLEDNPADGSELAREARSWRKKYQTAKSEHEALTATVTGLQRQLVEHAITGRVADTDDFWSAVDITDLLADDGTVDPAKIDTRLGEVLAAKPHWAPRQASAAAPTAEVSSTDTIDARPEPATWATLLSRHDKQ